MKVFVENMESNTKRYVGNKCTVAMQSEGGDQIHIEYESEDGVLRSELITEKGLQEFLSGIENMDQDDLDAWVRERASHT